MPPPTLIAPDRFAAFIAHLLGLLARHGHARGLPGPLLVLVWNHLRAIERRVLGLLQRRADGTLRRHPHRAAPVSRATPRRRPPGPLPRGQGWLVRLVPETAGWTDAVRRMLEDAETQALFDEVPQLRRALRPLATMLGLRLPDRTPPPDRPAPVSAPLRWPAPIPPAPAAPRAYSPQPPHAARPA